MIFDPSLSSSNPDGFAEAESQSEIVSINSDQLNVDETPLPEDAILRRAAAELAERKAELRALATLSSARNDTDDSLETITNSLADPSATVRAAAVRALYARNPEVATAVLNQTIRESAPEERARIGTALVDSGLIEVSESSDVDAQSFYAVRSLLFLLAKAGEAAPIIDVVRNHTDLNLRIALVRTLATSNSSAVVPALQQLLTDPSLSKEVRSAAIEAMLQLVE